KHGNEVYVIAPTADCLYPPFRSFGDTGEHMDEYDAAYEKLTGAICDVLSEEAGVDGSCCYVKFEECKLWGYNSFMF
ncbi:MAG: hypothetical protein II086_00270, partial [Ruminococcus sp.]|nr:hypothetical protein [Ruminococcus sp.]